MSDIPCHECGEILELMDSTYYRVVEEPRPVEEGVVFCENWHFCADCMEEFLYPGGGSE